MPSVGKSAQRVLLLSLGIAKAFQPCVGFDELDTATRKLFALNALSAEALASHRWVAGS